MTGLYSAPAPGQVTAIGSNLLRTGSGQSDDQVLGSQSKRYLEEIANARIFFDNITIGLRYETDDPSEVGSSFQGLRRRWIEYNKDQLVLQAGSVSALYGRGLAINAFESRPINYDSWLDGIKGNYAYKWSKDDWALEPSLAIKMIAGTLAFRPIPPADTTILNISARAVSSEFGFLGKKIILGTSFVQAFTNTSETFANIDKVTLREVNQPEVYLNFLAGSVEGFFEFTEMRSNVYQLKNIDTSISKTGNAFYGSLSYAGKNYGLTLEYKNYSYFVHSGATSDQNYFSKLPISSPPEVYKEYTYASLTRTTHAVNFDDELGFQIEANITAIPEYTITLNCAASSQHDPGGGSPVVPKLSDNNFLPFWETFAEVEHDLGGLNYIRLFAHRRSNTISVNTFSADIQRSTTVGGKFQYETARSQSILTSVEHQWMFDTEKPLNGHELINELLTLQYSINSISFGGILDYSTQDELHRHLWPQGFISFHIGGSHTILASYGAERGGLNCTGGICRYIPAFNGLRLTVTSQL